MIFQPNHNLCAFARLAIMFVEAVKILLLLSVHRISLLCLRWVVAANRLLGSKFASSQLFRPFLSVEGER